MDLGVVTAIELSVGKSLACWGWDECPVESSSSNDGEETQTNTQLSVLGGTSASDEAPEGQPLNPSHSQLFLLVQEFQVQEYSVLTPSKS
jgi:hypothetical protein